MSKLVCIIGGGGFVGRHLAAELARMNIGVRIPTRRREQHRELLVLPDAQVTNCNIFDDDSLRQQLQGCSAVVNLVGILNESGNTTFDKVHVELTRKVIQAAKAVGINRLLHMSALNAHAEKGSSKYLRSKGEAERLVRRASEQGMRTTIFRPSVIFGPDDSFFNRFAALLRFSPGFMPLACANARFAPVYVGDVAGAFARSLNHHECYGQSYDLCGPTQYTLREIVDYIMSLTHTWRWVLNLGPGLSKLQAGVLQYAPGKPFTLDNYRSLQTDAVCQGEFPAIFSIEPRTVESCVPYYLGIRGYYSNFRQKARRN